MPNFVKGDLAAQAVVRRIRASSNVLAIRFAPARTGPTTAGPTTRPASPLTGTVPTPSLTAAEPEGELETRELHCLWLDAPLSERPGGAVTRPMGGWVNGADALVRVVWEDALVEEEKPERGTWFDKALHIEFRGLRWRVLKSEAMGAGFRKPHTLGVWLVGASKQA